jgi:catechol 2,3-dioxygenase-like lactoylglutathione lyase family enzyme
MRRFSICATLTVLVLMGTLTPVQAQPPAPTAPNAAPASDVVIGSGNFSPIVWDLERSLRFYCDLMGAPAPATIPVWTTDPALLNFLAAPTGQVRFGSVRIPGSTMSVEIVEYKDVPRTALRYRLQDPGAVRLILTVRSLDSLLSRLKTQGVPVVTVGGAPLTIRDHNAGRAVMIQDPDGFYIQLVQPNVLPETTAPATSNVIGASFGLTINDTDQTMKVYRDLLGFKPEIESTFTADKTMADLMNTPGAQMRRSIAKVPGSAVEVEFLEFKGVDRKPIGARIQDQGATRFQLRVRDADAAVKTLVASGGTVVTTGGDGGPILMSGLRVAIVREPNNLFLVIMASVPRPARGQ